MTAQEQVLLFIDECLEGTDCFLVSFKIKPTNNYKFFIDSDSGFTLEKCVRINRKMRKMIEEAELYPDGDVSLEISSPGIDIPLTLTRQYIKNIGRKLEIELKCNKMNKTKSLIRLTLNGATIKQMDKGLFSKMMQKHL
jgi:ribosome maturation factor RimP